MEILANGLAITGLIIFIVGGIWFLIESFRENIWWGLGCLLITPVQLVFLIVHWSVAKKPFGIQLLGGCLLFVGTLLSESGGV